MESDVAPGLPAAGTTTPREPAMMPDPRGRWLTRGILVWIALVVLSASATFVGMLKFGLPGEAFRSLLFYVVPLVGALIVLSQPRHPTGWIFLVSGTAALIGGPLELFLLASYGAEGSWPAWMGSVETVVWPLSFPLMCLSLLWYPDGHLPSRRWKPLAVAGLAAIAIMMFPWSPDVSDAPLVLRAVDAVLMRTPQLSLIISLLAVASVPIRYRTADSDSRRRIRWVLWAVLLQIVAALVVNLIDLLGEVSPWLDGLVPAPIILGVPICVGIGLLRYRLFDIDVLLARTLLYTGLGVVLIGGYALVVTGVSAVADSPAWLAPAVSAVVVTFAFPPLRSQGRRITDRWLFGDRRDPLRVLATVHASTQGSATPYQDLVSAIASSLHLRFVALDLLDPGDHERLTGAVTRVACVGTGEGVPLVEIPISRDSTRLGTLVVAARSYREPLSADEVGLLDAVAGQVAARIENERLAGALQQSREHLVAAAEDERRRLRRDLHDGMGARLTAIGYAVEAATRADRDGSRRPVGAPDVASALAAAQADIVDSVTELRRIIDDLRPGSLDDLGLSEALTATTRRILGGAGIDTSTTISSAIRGAEPLDAATEAALYRIAVEAVTNAAHHSHASRCSVNLDCDDRDFILTVIDNGTGPLGAAAASSDSPGYHRVGGIGVPSMRERAGELGGTVRVAARSGGGTVVTAQLPRTAVQAHG